MSNHNLDTDRTRRLGFPEVIYGAGKSVETLIDILDTYNSRGENALVTRLQSDKCQALAKHFSNSFIDLSSGVFMLRECPTEKNSPRIGIVSAGTSDESVVNEAYHTLRFIGVPVVRINDVGVAGIHRLLDRLDELRSLEVLVAVAGFEGALPSVMGGLLRQPIIAVPTSTGYGVAKQGETALHAMLSSCANGISVVNIDNGYGAAMAAIRIIQCIDNK